MVAFADVIGIPSKTADSFVFESKRRIHVMMSGLDTDLFVPYNEEEALEKDDNISKDEGCETGGEVDHNTTSIEAAATTSAKTSNIIKNPPPSSSSTTTTPPPPPRPVMCYIGRLATEKMIHFLVSTLAHPDLANACLIIVGDGPELQPLYNQAVEIVGADNIYRHSFVDKAHEDPSISQSGSHLHGEVDPDYIFQLARGGGENNSNKLYRVIFTGMVHSETKIAQLYARSNIFVTASPSETFGFTVAESLSCGTPAVAVKEGAFKTVYSMIDDWLFKEGDVQDFVDKINLVMKLYKDPEVTRLCRERCRKIAVDGFSVKAAVKDLLGVYEEIVFGEQSKHIRECSQLVRERQATDGAHEIVDNGRDSEKKNE